MTQKQLERELKSNPAQVIHLAVVNNPSAVTNAMMADGLIEDSISEMDMHQMLLSMYENGQHKTVRYLLGQVAYIPGILPEGYDQLISKTSMQHRNDPYTYGTSGNQGDPLDPNYQSGIDEQFGSGDGSFFANMNWGQVFGDFADMFGDIFGEGDTYVMGAPGDQSGGYDGPGKAMDANQIIMYGGIALIAIIVLVVVLKVAK